MMRRRYEQPITGHWARADVFVNDFVQYAWSLQNPDGSFSTDWFEGRANEPNMERKVQTTGHILEWLIFTLQPKTCKIHALPKALNLFFRRCTTTAIRIGQSVRADIRCAPFRSITSASTVHRLGN